MYGLENFQNDVYCGVFPLNEFIHNNSIATKYSSAIFFFIH